MFFTNLLENFIKHVRPLESVKNRLEKQNFFDYFVTSEMFWKIFNFISKLLFFTINISKGCLKCVYDPNHILQHFWTEFFSSKIGLNTFL